MTDISVGYFSSVGWTAKTSLGLVLRTEQLQPPSLAKFWYGLVTGDGGGMWNGKCVTGLGSAWRGLTWTRSPWSSSGKQSSRSCASLVSG